MRPAPEKFNTFITFTTFAIFEPFIQMRSTVTRKKCHSEYTDMMKVSYS
jgi:hypothetical protein